jgi:hypothetical protein
VSGTSASRDTRAGVITPRALQRARLAQALLAPLCLSAVVLTAWWALRDIDTTDDPSAGATAHARTVRPTAGEPPFDLQAFDAPIAVSAPVGPLREAPSSGARALATTLLLAISQDPGGQLRAHLYDRQHDESFTLTAGQAQRGFRAVHVRSDGVTLAQGELELHLPLEVSADQRPGGAP